MITRLTITNFRNHSVFRLETENKNVILTGPNGAGKTNIMEAVSLLSGGAGFRRANSADIARFGANGYAVAAELSGGTEISVYWEVGFGHRKAKVNGEAANLSDLAKHIGVVWLTPAEDQLFLSPPAVRRAFLDNLVAGFDDSHTGRVARLGKLLSERAFALKGARDEKWLNMIDASLASAAVSISDARARYAAELNHFFAGGEMALSGILESRIIGGEKAGDIESFYKKYLSENRFLVADKMTIDGPHRSDFSVKNTALNLGAEKTSSGQQKLILNGLVIANAKLIGAKNPDRPRVILLDEAAGHLDGANRSGLFDALSKTGAQVFLSGTDAATFANVPDAVRIEVAA
jgi:DNA replication and repair protein RecF